MTESLFAYRDQSCILGAVFVYEAPRYTDDIVVIRAAEAAVRGYDAKGEIVLDRPFFQKRMRGCLSAREQFFKERVHLEIIGFSGKEHILRMLQFHRRDHLHRAGYLLCAIYAAYPSFYLPK